MSGGKRKRKTSILESIRKPTAPPSKKFGGKKPEEKVDPVGRTSKHKKRDNNDADL